MNITKSVKNKKGFAIEIAIVFMVIMVALSVLLLSIFVYSVNKTRVQKDALYKDVLVDSVGESFYSWVKDGKEGDFTYTFEDTKYQYSLENDGDIDTMILKHSDTVVLVVKIQEVSTKYNIIQWSCYEY